MFTRTNEEITLEGLRDFIEKPSQNCKKEELEEGISKVITVLKKNPPDIISLFKGHEYIFPVLLLDDLATKMQQQGCLEKLEKLFDECLDELVEVCIYNVHDLLRCINVMPAYSDSVIENILSSPVCVKRLFESDNDLNLMEKLKQYPSQVDALVVMPDSKLEDSKLEDGCIHIKSGEKESLLYSITTLTGKAERNKPITKLELKGQLGNVNYTKFSEALKTNNTEELTKFLPDILTITSKQGSTLSNFFEEFFKKNDKIRTLLDEALPEPLTEIVVNYRGYSRGR